MQVFERIERTHILSDALFLVANVEIVPLLWESQVNQNLEFYLLLSITYITIRGREAEIL